MRKVILQWVKATFPIAAVFSTFINTAYTQQNIVANKDDTHPEISERQYIPARITFFSAAAMNGYNEVQWSAISEQDTRRYIIEYSDDGINYVTAAEAMVTTGAYTVKHYTTDIGSLLYRIRIEKKDGRFVNSVSFMLEGDDQPPVKIYPTMVEGNTINLKMDFPVQSLRVNTAGGQQVYTKNLGGLTGSTQIVIPALSKGIYWISFYGNGWQSTEKFVIGR